MEIYIGICNHNYKDIMFFYECSNFEYVYDILNEVRKEEKRYIDVIITNHIVQFCKKSYYTCELVSLEKLYNIIRNY